MNKMLKRIKNEHILLVVGSLALLFALARYSNVKLTDGLTNYGSQPKDLNSDNSVLGSNMPSQAMNVGLSSAQVPQNGSVSSPSSLLPSDSNSEWASLNPQGKGSLENVNLLQAGSMTGINTVGTSLRNANLQIRAEPPNPKMSVGPWQNSTIERDPNFQYGLKVNC